ncbi:hypothetical protein Ancab_035810 [Ancistrocladus abbreviatus]
MVQCDQIHTCPSQSRCSHPHMVDTLHIQHSTQNLQLAPENHQTGCIDGPCRFGRPNHCPSHHTGPGNPDRDNPDLGTEMPSTVFSFGNLLAYCSAHFSVFAALCYRCQPKLSSYSDGFSPLYSIPVMWHLIPILIGISSNMLP